MGTKVALVKLRCELALDRLSGGAVAREETGSGEGIETLDELFYKLRVQ